MCGAKSDANQLERYALALREHAGSRGRLIALLPASRIDELQRHELDTSVRLVTWEQLAVIADSTGARVSNELGEALPWRVAARQPDAPARQHALDLFLQHLREDHNVIIEPLTTSHARALMVANTAISLSDQLAETALDRARLGGREGNRWAHDLGRRWVIEPTQPVIDRWWAQSNGRLELFRSVSGKHHEAGGCVFIAGVRLPPSGAEALDERIADVCAADQATEWPWPLTQRADREARYVCSVLPLEAVATAAGTFDGQADFLARWLKRTIGAVTLETSASNTPIRQ